MFYFTQWMYYNVIVLLTSGLWLTVLTQKSIIFDHLSSEEINQVIRYMNSVSSFNLRAWTGASIAMIDSFPPNKTTALDYLDNGGVRPVREAKVVLLRGDLPEHQRNMVEYKVGPLPNPKYHKKIKTIPYKYRLSFSGPEFSKTSTLIHNQLSIIDKEITRITGYGVQSTKRLTWAAFADSNIKRRRRLVIQIFKNTGEGYFLHPIGLQFIVDLILPNIELIWFRGRVFSSIHDLRSHLTIIKDIDEEITTDFSSLRKSTPNRDAEKHINDVVKEDEKAKRSPKQIYPDGARYKINGHFVSWLGWSLHVGIRTVSGMYIFDVRFQGKRIVYELSLQDTVVLYGGDDPMHMHASIFDSSFALGANSFTLQKGVDCPEHSASLSFHHYFGGRAVARPNSLCVFEHNTERPIRRHSWSNGMRAHGMVDTVLVIRSITILGNYDYIIDYIFHHNGVMETKVSLSGYILPSYNHYGNAFSNYGFELQDSLLGNIHNHLINFKVDLDICGTANNFETLDISAKSRPNPFNGGKNINSRQFSRNWRQNEKAAAMKFDFNNPKYYLVSNSAGNSTSLQRAKSYRILPQSQSKLLLPIDWEWEPGVAWARFQVAITRRKETEDTSSSPFNTMNPTNPTVDFRTFFEDDESIIDEDLVAWVTIGTHHIPRREDVPIVTTPGAQLGFLLLPFNYFDTDPSMTSQDNSNPTEIQNGGNWSRNHSNNATFCQCNNTHKKMTSLSAAEADMTPQTTGFPAEPNSKITTQKCPQTNNAKIFKSDFLAIFLLCFLFIIHKLQ